jgi:hypothetical protein
MITPDFERAESGILLPKVETSDVSFLPQPISTCNELHEVLEGMRDAVEDEPDPEVFVPMTNWHNDLVTGCTNRCRGLSNGCGISELSVTIGNSGGFEVVRERPTTAFLEKIRAAILFLNEYNDGIPHLSTTGKQMKGIIEIRTQRAIEDKAIDADIVPDVTDGAYEILAMRSGAGVSEGPNFRVALNVFGKLFDASIDQRKNPNDPELESRHMVIPAEAGLIQRTDVEAVYDNPNKQFQYWLRIANEPKGNIDTSSKP